MSSLSQCCRCLRPIKYTALAHRQRASFSVIGALLCSRTHYEVLGVDRKASTAHIRDAFVTLSKQVHPDKNQSDPKNHQKFVAINEAYSVLSKPTMRREYDFSLVMRERSQQQRAASHTAQSPVSHEPPWRDETIFSMRDRSKDHQGFYGHDNYYGVPGVRRKSNHMVLLFCVCLIVAGCLIFIGVFKWSYHKRQDMMDKVDRRNLAYLKEAEARARMYGNKVQLERLKQRLEAKQQDKPDS